MTDDDRPGLAALEEAPVLVQVTRGGFVESVHRATVLTRFADGRVVAHGAVDAPVLPRSTLKPIQALAMVGAGLDLPPELLALVCSSHSAEKAHRDGVRRILASAGLGEDDLGNTPALPYGEAEHARWLAAGRAPAPIAQDCSGKHAGMLATCVHAGWDLPGYLDPEHPLQRHIAEVVAQRCGPIAHTTIDGCGAPLFAVPLSGLAAAFGALAAAPPHSDDGRVAAAMRAHPWMVGGTDRDVTAFMEAVPGLVAKDGAESVYAAGLADGSAVAVKVADGAPFARARQVLLAEALLALTGDGEQPADRAEWAALRALSTVPVLGHGRQVGAVEVVPGARGRHG